MKIISCHVPFWFLGSEIIIQVLFALVTLAIAYYAYRVHRITRQRSSLLFGGAFLGISGAYFVQALFNYLLLIGVRTPDIIRLTNGSSVAATMQLSIFAVFLHMLLMLVGVSLLAYVTLKERGAKIYILLLLLSIIAVLFTVEVSLVYFLIVSIFLAFITAQHYQRHLKKPSKNTLYVFLGFGMVFLGTVQLAFATTLSALYISGHFIAMIGYIVLLASLLRIVKR